MEQYAQWQSMPSPSSCCPYFFHQPLARRRRSCAPEQPLRNIPPQTTNAWSQHSEPHLISLRAPSSRPCTTASRATADIRTAHHSQHFSGGFCPTVNRRDAKSKLVGERTRRQRAHRRARRGEMGTAAAVPSLLVTNDQQLPGDQAKRSLRVQNSSAQALFPQCCSSTPLVISK